MEQQKGFVAKRQFIEHPVSLESAGRRLALDPGSFLPIFVFFGFVVVFPSVARQYMFQALSALGAPWDFWLYLKIFTLWF